MPTSKPRLPARMGFGNHWLVRYVFALLAIAAGYLLRSGLTRLAGGSLPTYITFYPAVMLSALLGGLGPGLVATVAAALSVDYFILPPLGLLTVASSADAVALAFFTGTCVFMSVVAELYRRARQQVAAHEMEALVGDRGQAPARRSRQGWLLNAAMVVSLAFMVATRWQPAVYMRAESEADKWVTHTHVVIQKLDQLLSALKDAESGQRGYLLTGEEIYLEPYQAALGLVRSNLAGLKQLTQDNATQQKCLAGIEPLILEKEAELKQTIELRRSQGLPAALEVVTTEKGRIIMDQIRKGVAEAQDEENRLRAERAAARSAEAGKALQSLLAGGVLVFLLMATVFFFLKQENIRRTKAEADVRHHRDHLKEMVVARTEELGRSNEQLKQEISEHQQAREARAQLAAIVESSDDAILSKDLDGNITSWNRGAERMFGYRPGEVIGRPINLLLPRDRQDEEVPIMARIQAAERVDHFETVRLTKDGRSLAVSVTISPLKDGGGRIIGASKIVRDISARLRAERRTALLAETASRLLSSDDPQRVVDELCGKVLEFLDSQVFFNFLVDDKQQRLRLNACAGIARPEAGKIEWLDHCAALCGCAPRDGCRLVAGSIQETHDPRTALVKPYGIQAYACHPLMVAGHFLGTLSFGTRTRKEFTGEELSFMKAVADLVVTAIERKRAQAALLQTAEEVKRSNRDLEQFAYIASHDLQEPLRAVGGYVKLLQRRFPENMDAKALEYINGAAEGADRMERLISDLLAFSRVGTHGGTFSPASLDAVLNRSVAQPPNQHRRAPRPKSPAIPCRRWPWMPRKLCRSSRTSSATPSSSAASARRKFMSAPNTQPGRWVFSVRDNGIGIEPQYFERIFQIFQRLHTRKHYPGTGIGLAICKKIVERHDGAIWVESEPGHGSTFFFSLPENPAIIPQKL